MTTSDSPAPARGCHVLITGMGRSGTTFLGHLLKEADDVVARHEHLGDKHLVALSYYRPDHPYVAHTLRQRAESLYRQHGDGPIYVHVDGGVRYAIDAARRCFQPGCFHLVRDGRRVVQSMYPRHVFTERAGTLPVLPEDPDLVAGWDNWPRFEKLCWYWRDSVDRLLKQDLPLLRFEDILRDYDLLHDTLLRPTGIGLGREQWRQACDQPVNATRFRLKWLLPRRHGRLAWNDDYERRFRALCGPTMARLGYPLD